jgi:hypothetical protein
MQIPFRHTFHSLLGWYQAHLLCSSKGHSAGTPQATRRILRHCEQCSYCIEQRPSRQTYGISISPPLGARPLLVATSQIISERPHGPKPYGSSYSPNRGPCSRLSGSRYANVQCISTPYLTTLHLMIHNQWRVLGLFLHSYLAEPVCGGQRGCNGVTRCVRILSNE